VLFLQGCTKIAKPAPGDPWEGMNRDIMAFNSRMDRTIMQPVARGYQFVMPKFLDVGITNAFYNANDIGVTINDFLQWKPRQAFKNTWRFAINSTFGLAGFIDVADVIGLPRQNEDFNQTLAVWGVPRGPFIMLPFYGPSYVRGVFGRVGDVALQPLTYVSAYFSSTAGWALSGLNVLGAIDKRADLLGLEKVVDQAAIDRYAFIKSGYTQQRDYLIRDGRMELLELDDYIEDDSLYEGLE
jgi:phospholipid-binding lipoprotein MlaA